MALANVPSGEQRSRFLAVGLADNTVRVISLDPNVSFLVGISDNCFYDENLARVLRCPRMPFMKQLPSRSYN